MFTPENATAWLKNFAGKIEANKAYLSDLDTPIGDADHGNNMARGVAAVTEALDKQTDPDLKAVFQATAMALISKVGGASGPLYGTAFLEMAKKAPETSNVSDLLDVAFAGLEKRGGAVPGDKTMLDVWQPLLADIKAGALTQDEIDKAVEGTKDMLAKKGRASYLGDRSVGHIDPGAQSSGYLFEALRETEGIL